MDENKGQVKTISVEEAHKKLIDKTLVLDPTASGMFVDEKNKFQLDFFKEDNDKIHYTDAMDPQTIMRSIKAGILRVYDDKKDISNELGGKVKNEDWKRKSIVDGIPKKADKDKDMPLLRLLGRTTEKEVLRDIQALNDFDTLVRLEELEKQGKNPSEVGRPNVLKLLSDKKKKIPGVSEAKALSQDTEEVIVK